MAHPRQVFFAVGEVFLAREAMAQPGEVFLSLLLSQGLLLGGGEVCSQGHRGGAGAGHALEMFGFGLGEGNL